MDRKEIIEIVDRLIEDGDDKEALKVIEPLVQSRDIEAMGIAGSIMVVSCENEEGGRKAAELLAEAAELGEGVAAHNLGTVYFTGIPGVKTDKELSKKYYLRARDLGCVLCEPEFYKKL